MIRLAVDTDFERMADIYNQYLGNGTMDLNKVDGGYFHDYSPDQMIVCELDGNVQGYALLKPYSPRPGYKIAGETSIYFDPKYIGRGYAHQLQTWIMDIAGEKGYKHLVAKIWASNEKSINFHLRLGYMMVGIQKNIGYIDGEYVDVAILQYLIDEET